MKSVIIGLLCLAPSAALALDLPVTARYCTTTGERWIIDPAGLAFYPEAGDVVACHAVAVSGHRVTTECMQKDGMISQPPDVSTLLESRDHQKLYWTLPSGKKITLTLCGDRE